MSQRKGLILRLYRFRAEVKVDPEMTIIDKVVDAAKRLFLLSWLSFRYLREDTRKDQVLYIVEDHGAFGFKGIAIVLNDVVLFKGALETDLFERNDPTIKYTLGRPV